MKKEKNLKAIFVHDKSQSKWNQFRWISLHQLDDPTNCRDKIWRGIEEEINFRNVCFVQ